MFENLKIADLEGYIMPAKSLSTKARKRKAYYYYAGKERKAKKVAKKLTKKTAKKSRKKSARKTTKR